MLGMRRRDFVALLGGAAAWPRAAGAQQSAMPVVGVLSSQSQESEAAVLASWGQALNESGYVRGRNVEFEYRFADGPPCACRPARILSSWDNLTNARLAEPMSSVGRSGRAAPEEERPCVARRFRRVSGERSCISIRPLIGARAPGHHGYQRVCDLITGQASTGPFGSL